MAQANRVTVAGQLIELDALRYTPCEIAAVAFEREAKLLAAAKLGSNVTVTGFLAAKSRSSRTLMLHATEIEFAEGE